MKLLSVPLRDAASGADALADAVRSVEAAWQDEDPPALEELWAEHDPSHSLTTLTALVKADLRCRFTLGQRPTIAEYLDQFPELRHGSDRVVSLVYEEYCLLEEWGELPDRDQFCARYQPWHDSLQAQLECHHLLSQVVTSTKPRVRFPDLGDRFKDRFRLLSDLGQGGMARVYLANDELVGNRKVALKVTPNRGDEGSIQGRLDHERIVPVLTVEVDDETGLRGLCMPYRPGLPLDEVLRRIHPEARPAHARVLWEVLAPVDSPAVAAGPARQPGWQDFPAKGSYAEGVVWIIRALAQALAYAHTEEILHRDIKPANVLLTLRDGPKLLDFNLAHDPHVAAEAEAAVRGGTLPYMAPEQLTAFLEPARWTEVGQAADLYSLGLILRELLTGHRPESPDPALPLPRALREQLERRSVPWPSLRSINSDIPHALETIADHCLAYSPSSRYANASDLAEDLGCFLNHCPLKHAPNTSRLEVSRNFVRRYRWPLLILTGLLSLSLAFVGLYPAVLPLVFRPAFSKGVTLLKTGRADEARQIFERLVAQYPSSSLALIYLASGIERGSEPMSAVDRINRAAAQYDAAVRLSDRQTSSDDAEAALEQFVAEFPHSNSRALVALGTIRSHRGQWDAAQQAYSKATGDPLTAYRAYQGLAHVADKLGQPDLCRTAMTESIRSYPPRLGREVLKKSPEILADLYLTRGMASIKWAEQWKTKGEFAKASQQFTAALRDTTTALQLEINHEATVPASEFAGPDPSNSERSLDEALQDLALQLSKAGPVPHLKTCYLYLAQAGTGAGSLALQSGDPVTALHRFEIVRSSCSETLLQSLDPNYARWIQDQLREIAVQVEHNESLRPTSTALSHP